MDLTRREFLFGAAGGLSCLPLIAGGSPAADAMPGCAVLAFPSGCVLGESLTGYRLALGVEAVTSQGGWRTAVLPSAGRIEAQASWEIVERLEQGGRLLLESGGAYLDAAELAEHRHWMRKHFD